MIASGPPFQTTTFIRDRGRMLLGDLNGDFNIDHRDFLLLLQQWGPCPCCAADLDGDGDVDEDDYTLMGGE